MRDKDDDLQYVGTIDATTGVFTPNVDGPNPKRKWQANNVGDVFVCCEVSLDIPVRKDPPKKAKTSDAGETDAKPADKPAAEAVAAQPIPRVKKRFFARSHLIVTIPVYARWMVLDWEDR